MAKTPTFRLSPTGDRKLYDVHVHMGSAVNDDLVVELSEKLAEVQSIKRVHQPYISSGTTVLWITMNAEKRTWREANAYVRDVLMPLVTSIVTNHADAAELETAVAGTAPSMKQRYNNRSFRR